MLHLRGNSDIGKLFKKHEAGIPASTVSLISVIGLPIGAPVAGMYC